MQQTPTADGVRGAHVAPAEAARAPATALAQHRGQQRTLEVLAHLRDALLDEPRHHPTPRGSLALRERSHLLDEVSGHRLRVLSGGDPDRLLHDVGRLLEKVRCHLQRVAGA